MLVPSIFGNSLDDDFMDFPFEDGFFPRSNPLYGKREKNIMKTDIKETESGYELDIDLPGFKKEDVQAKLENGYLTISAAKSLEKNEGDEKKDKYIRKERYEGSMSRSFYVGEAVTQEDVKAKFEDGILKIAFPKKDVKQEEQKKLILIS